MNTRDEYCDPYNRRTTTNTWLDANGEPSTYMSCIYFAAPIRAKWVVKQWVLEDEVYDDAGRQIYWKALGTFPTQDAAIMFVRLL